MCKMILRDAIVTLYGKLQVRLELDGSVTSSAQNRAPANVTIFSEATQRTPRDRDPNQEPAEATAMSAHEQKTVASGRVFFWHKIPEGGCAYRIVGTRLKDLRMLQD